MDTAASIDADLRTAILSPFVDGPAAGEDLRLDATPQSLYFRLRDARSEARAQERSAESDPAADAGVPAQWKTVRDLAAEALRDRTKDVEIAVWLTESLTRSHGLNGLAEASAILAGLVERFWNEGLFPSPDEADPDGRLIAITGLSGLERNGSLVQPLQKTVLFHLADGSPLALWQYERSREVAGTPPVAGGHQPTTTLPEFGAVAAAADGVGQAALRELGRQVSHAAGAWAHLETVLARVVAPGAAPSTGRVAEILERLRTTVERHVTADRPELAAAEGEEPGRGVHSAEPRLDAAVTRDGLLGQMADLARLFRRLEPNSPISYTLEEAVRRANLSWPELIRELVPELPQRASIMSGAGLKRPAD